MDYVKGIEYSGQRKNGRFIPHAIRAEIDRSRFEGRDSWSLKDWENNDPYALDALAVVDLAAFNRLHNNQTVALSVEAQTVAHHKPSNQITMNSASASVFPQWDWETYQEKAPEMLQRMETEKPLQFAAIYRAKYGVIPDGFDQITAQAVKSQSGMANTIPLPAKILSWSWDDWQANATDQAMREFEELYPDHFSAVYRAKYGTNPESSMPTTLPSTTHNNRVDAVQPVKAGWDWEDYQKKDPRALEQLERTNFPAFKALYKAKYGIDLSQ